MPGKVKVKIISGRNLPVMDRSSDTTDAYVEIKLGNTSYKTDVVRKSLNPLWNSEWYRFEVDDLELQDEPLQIRLMDHDTYSANDAIGKVYINLNPLLTPVAGLSNKWSMDANSKNQTSNSIMSGWIPVYDTMHGIRGEVNVTVKVELFTDFNKFRQSSCGVQFFCSSTIPHGFYTQVIHGFVEELVVNDDPEYQWIDKIRTPRASNEARQTLFFKLSGELQRKIGVKTLDLGGNAVIGYNQCFDLEGESGIVARGIGTAVTLIKHQEVLQKLDEGIAEEYTVESPVQTNRCQEGQTIMNSMRRGHHRTDSTGGKTIHSPGRLNTIPCIHRRSSDSDLSITPKGNSLTGSDKSSNLPSSNYQYNRPAVLHSGVDNFDMMEYPFVTLLKYPPGFIIHLGGAISARSVKLLERITNIEEPESRDTWWSELRMEIRSHARALNCNAVLGYTETTSICDEICVLSASGTAAFINFCNGDQYCGLPAVGKLNISNKDLMTTSLDRNDFEQEKNNKTPDSSLTKPMQINKNHQVDCYFENNQVNNITTACSLCHIPYNESNVSFRMTMTNCAVCKSIKVPDVLLTTIEIPENIPITGKACFLQSYVCRPKRDLKGELNAKEISESLPFLEYELHRLLINKMKVKGMNAIFGLKVRITIGEKLLIGIATGSGLYLSPLPAPALPKLVAGNGSTDTEKILEMQALLAETMKKNKEIYELKPHIDQEIPANYILSNEDTEDKKNTVDLNNKDCCVLEMDDSEDIEAINLLIEQRAPDGFQVVNTETVPGSDEVELAKNLQMFTQVWRARIPLNHPASYFDKHFQKLLQSVYFKLRRMIPCAICNLEFRIELPEPDEIQLTMLGMALALGDPSKITNKYKRKNCHSIKDNKKIDDDLIFTLEEDQVKENTIPITSQSGLLNTQFIKYRQKSPTRSKSQNSKQRFLPTRERHGVDISPLSYIPGGRIEKYLGYLNFFFIRETNSIREGGGLSGFVHSFITEVLAIVRAHVVALGGNAMVAYFMTECVLYHNTHKNQGQCLINVGGDAVFVSYFTEE